MGVFCRGRYYVAAPREALRPRPYEFDDLPPKNLQVWGL
jgi:hypothetical protein